MKKVVRKNFKKNFKKIVRKNLRKIAKKTFLIVEMIIVITITSFAVFAQTSSKEAVSSSGPARCSITNSPDLGTTGYFEWDFGLSHDKGNFSTPLLIKYTISQNWEVRFGSGGYISERDGPNLDRSVGDTSFLIQWLPSAPKGDQFRWAIFGGGSVPTSTGTKRFSPKGWDYNLGVAIAKPLGSWRIDSNFTVNSINNSDTKVVNRSIVYGFSNAVSHAIKRWTPFAEMAFSFEPDGSNNHTMVFGTSYKLSSKFILDGAINHSFNKDSPPYTFQFGCSLLLGRSTEK